MQLIPFIVPQVAQVLESIFCRWFESHSDLSAGSVQLRHLMSMKGSGNGLVSRFNYLFHGLFA